MSSITVKRITDRYDYAVESLNKALTFAELSDIASEQECLVSTANILYEVIEWSIKYILHSKYDKDKILYEKELKVVEGNSFYEKLSLLKLHANPLTTTFAIDLDLILRQKQEVRNNPEHSGNIPHFNSIKQVFQEASKLIINYIDSSYAPFNLEQFKVHYNESSVSKWEEFFDAADYFDSNRNYILIIDKISSSVDLIPLSYVPWSLIIDLDQDTALDGLYEKISSEISTRKKVHLFTKDDNQTFSPFSALYWYAAKGIQGRSQSISSDFRDWSKKYSTHINKTIDAYSKVFSDKPTTVIVISENEVLLRVCEILYNNFDKSLKYVYAVNDSQRIENVTNIYEGRVIKTNIGEISKGLFDRQKYFNINSSHVVYSCPSVENNHVVIKNEDYFWIEEDLEFVHLNILNNYKFSEVDTRNDFLRGNQITWRGLKSHNDIDRDKTKELKKVIEKSLKDRKSNCFVLQHYPGIGGTTIGKRIAWELHDTFPSVVLKRYSPQETVNKLYSLFEYSKLPVFVYAEVSEVKIDEIERLVNEVGGRTFPCVFLVIQRKLSSGLNNPNLFVLPQSLTDVEFSILLQMYKDIAAPKQLDGLSKLESSNNQKERHPFYLGLVTFEENFSGLQSFVQKAIDNATEKQKKAIVFISLVHYYGQKAFPVQHLANLFGWPSNSVLDLNEHLTSDLLYLLINETNNHWRPLHYLISEELLHLILGGNNKELWRNNLSENCIDLISLGEHDEINKNELFLDIIERLFVFRDNEELLGKEEDKDFSNVIDDIPTEEGKFRIFKHLTDVFPNEPHLWGHLARYYSLRRKDFDNAIYAIDKALNISEKPDPLLLHMKGMCLRANLYELTSFYKIHKEIFDSLKNKELELLIENAESQFEQSRKINKNYEHSYISHIQLLINIIDFGFVISNLDSKNEFLLSPKYSYYRDKLDTCEELLSSLKRNRSHMGDTQYMIDVDSKLKELYGDYTKAIQGWTNILSRNDIYKPPVRRQIVRAYLRRKIDIKNLEPHEIQRIVNLMEENIIEEPGEEKNIFLWFNAVRYQNHVDLNRIIEKLSQWKSTLNSLDKTYYLYVLYSIEAISKSSIAKERATSISRECSEMARSLPNRTFCFEWVGKGVGLKQLLPNKSAVTRDFSGEMVLIKENLSLIEGKIIRIKGPESGEIELQSGLVAFFTPARANLGKGVFKDKDLNKDVRFFVGFSYDGLRAWEVVFKN